LDDERARWTAQEIVDLLVAFYRKEGRRLPGKSFFRCTVGKALALRDRYERERREGAFTSNQPESTPDLKSEKDRMETGSESPGAKSRTGEARLQLFLELLNRARIFRGKLHFERIMQRGPMYMAVVNGGVEIRLGTAYELNNFRVTQANIVDTTGINLVVPSGRKGTLWFPVVELIIQIAKLEHTEFEYGIDIETREYLTQALNALSRHEASYANRVEIQSSENIYSVNISIRNGQRENFIHPYSIEKGEGQGAVRQPVPWPRFAFWTTNGRLLVHLSWLRSFLGTPAGGNERIAADTLKEGLRALGFLEEMLTGRRRNKLRRQNDKVSQRWWVSPSGFVLNPDCEPQPGLEPELEPEITEAATAERDEANRRAQTDEAYERARTGGFATGDPVRHRRNGTVSTGARNIKSFSADWSLAYFEELGPGVAICELVHAEEDGDEQRWE
jgi:hypothetical protein